MAWHKRFQPEKPFFPIKLKEKRRIEMAMEKAAKGY